jgi:hypothetical protein
MATITLNIKDETATGKIFNEVTIQLASEMVTVQEIIEARVAAEVRAYNKKTSGFYSGLVQPTDAEKALNGYKLKPRQQVDEEKQVYAALQAFKQNGYFVLVDNIQATELGQMLVINNKTDISFIKLTPLVGG